jgi:hypothetical protein
MRQLLTIALLFLSQLLFGQLKLRKANIPDHYLFNNTRDTIYLTNEHLGQFTWTDSIKIIDSIQIDGIGSKEIIFNRLMHGYTSSHGGMYDIEDNIVIKKYEIWNLDTKTLLFEAISDYKNDFNNFYAYDFQWGSYRKGQGSENYKYDFIVNKTGQVSISNLRKTMNCKPDHAEGFYKFLNGKYALE